MDRSDIHLHFCQLNNLNNLGQYDSYNISTSLTIFPKEILNLKTEATQNLKYVEKKTQRTHDNLM